MVISCSAFGCTNRQTKGSSVQFHRFPLKNPSLLSQWLKEVRRKNFVPSKYSFICSEHFIDTDYQIRPGATVKLLNTNAVPSIFSGFPTHLLKPLPVTRRLLQRNCTNNIHYVPTNFYANLPNNSNLNAGTSVCDESSVETKVEEVIDSSEKRSFSDTNKTPDDNELEKYLIHLDNVDLGYYVKDILDYIGGYIVRSIIKTIVCVNCVQLLLENRLDQRYSNCASRLPGASRELSKGATSYN